ncbi:MAG: flagellar basal-body rod protein FlgG [Porticoccaceae bacterium]|jgi:flagellar basal-body rod protein FlgG
MKSRLPVVGCCLLTTLLIGMWLGQLLPLNREVDEEIAERSSVSPFNSDGWQLASGQDSGPVATLQTGSPFESAPFSGHPATSSFRSEATESAETPVGPDVAYFPEVITETAAVTGAQTSATVEDAHAEQPSPSTNPLSREDAAVWNAELKDLPPNQAAEILRLRQQLGSVASESLGLSFPEISAAENTEPPGLFPELAAGDARPIPVNLPSTTDSEVMLVSAADEPAIVKQVREEADRVYAESQANQKTIGFKRTQIVLLNVSTSAPSDAAGVTDKPTAESKIQTVGDESAPKQTQSPVIHWLTRLDLRPGEMRQTGNPLDLMINGPGWLQVERNGRHEFVRSGMLGFRKDGRLGIHTGAGLLPIVPAIQFPVERQRIVIAESGDIYSETAAGHEKVDGQLVSVNFRDASALKRTPAGTYAATDDSGPALATRPGFAMFLQAVLEESNVDIETELADAMRLKAIAGQLAKQP